MVLQGPIDIGVQHLINRIFADSESGFLAINDYREEIFRLHLLVTDEPSQERLLMCYELICKLARANLEEGSPEMEALDADWIQYRNLFLAAEAADGDRIDYDELARRTKREIDAGRMPPDDPFHFHAVSMSSPQIPES